MLSKNQDQNAQEGAIALQVAGSAENVTVNQTTHNGLSFEQVRAVVQDTFQAQFYQFMNVAGDIATVRAQKLLDNFIERIKKENPTALEQANNPDFRYALLTAQKAHAINGDDNLESLLVELLVERSKEKGRTLQQIVLTEALEVASKLTEGQIAALTIAFLLRRTLLQNVFTFEHFLHEMNSLILPYVEHAKLSEPSFSHMAFTGCGVVEVQGRSLHEIFIIHYFDLWQTGFPTDDPAIQKLTSAARKLLRPSAHTPGYLEIFGGATGSSEKRKLEVPDTEQYALIEMLVSRERLSGVQIKERCIASCPGMAGLYDVWDNTGLNGFLPSAVGMAIAHANIIQKRPDFGPLSTWIA